MPDSSQTPISGGPHDPYEKYRVEEIQKNKETRDTPEERVPIQETHHSAFAVYAILILKRFIELFEHTTEQGLSTSAQEDVLDHLNLFKEALEILKTEDRSQDSHFLNKLADLWHHLLEDSYSFRRHTLLSIKIRTFIKELQHYPEHHEHSLGYYLTEYAGQKWLPFPYLEMIRNLHASYKKSPTNCLLSIWSKEIQEMIELIKPSQQ